MFYIASKVFTGNPGNMTDNFFFFFFFFLEGGGGGADQSLHYDASKNVREQHLNCQQRENKREEIYKKKR